MLGLYLPVPSGSGAELHQSSPPRLAHLNPAFREAEGMEGSANY